MGAMITRYDRTRRFEWTEEAKTAFVALQEAIKTCPKLFFPSQEGTIKLHTDASKYGVGEYLFQEIQLDGQMVVQPIAFLSRSLRGCQLRWSTAEKRVLRNLLSIAEISAFATISKIHPSYRSPESHLCEFIRVRQGYSVETPDSTV